MSELRRSLIPEGRFLLSMLKLCKLQGFTLTQQDAKSLLPVAEVLWKPEDASRMISEAMTPETWDLALEDDNANMENQPWAQLAEECSLDEVKSVLDKA